MLVVTRKPNQTVVFPELGVSVEITKVSGKSVRVGIEAPDEIRIVRGELIEDERAATEGRSAKTTDASPAATDASSEKSTPTVQENRSEYRLENRSAETPKRRVPAREENFSDRGVTRWFAQSLPADRQHEEATASWN